MNGSVNSTDDAVGGSSCSQLESALRGDRGLI